MDPLNDEEAALAVDAATTADSIAARYARLFPLYEQDFQSSAQWGAIRAAQSFDASGGETWKRWQKMCIRGEIVSFLRRTYNHRRELWSQEALESVCEREKETAFDCTDGRAFDEIIADLPDKHQKIIRLIYQEGMTVPEASRVAGYSRRQGLRLHHEAIAILKRKAA